VDFVVFCIDLLFNSSTSLHSHLLIMDEVFYGRFRPQYIRVFQKTHDKRKIIKIVFFLRGCGASVVGESVTALTWRQCALVTRRFLCLASDVNLESAEESVL